MHSSRRWIAALVCTVLLTACTPDSTHVATEAQPSATGSAAPTDQAGDNALLQTPDPSSESVMTVDPSTGTVITGESGDETEATTSDSTIFPQLGQGTTSPLSTSDEAPGIEWADGSPVRASVFSMAQARPSVPDYPSGHGEDQLRSLGHSVINIDKATSSSLFGFELPSSYYTGDSSDTTEQPKVGFADSTGWHSGPKIDLALGVIGHPTTAVSGKTLVWLGAPFGDAFYGTGETWTVLSWTQGDKRATTIGTHRDLERLVDPRGLAIANGKVYFSALGDLGMDGRNLYSIPLTGGKPHLVARDAGNPIGANGRVYWEGTGPAPAASDDGFTPLEYSVTSVWTLSTTGTPQKLISISQEENDRAAEAAVASQSTTGVAFDSQGRPISAPGLVSAFGDVVLFRHRSQPLIFNTKTRTATRIAPLLTSTADNGGVRMSAAVCQGGVALSLPTDPNGNTVILWFEPGSQRLTWLTAADPSASLNCAGDALTIVSGAYSSGTNSFVDIVRARQGG